MNEEFEEEGSEWKKRVTEVVVNEFYKAIRQILKNSIPRGPATGSACPQTSPNRGE